MKLVKTLSVMALLVFPISPAVLAQEGAGSEWHSLNLEGADLFAQRQYDRCMVVAKKALELAEKNVGPDHLDVATSLINLARIIGARLDYSRKGGVDIE